MKFQKRFFLSLVIISSITVFAQGQSGWPFYISGPTSLCAGECYIEYAVQSNLPDGLNSVVNISWETSLGISLTFISDNTGIFCIANTTSSSVYISANIITSDGQIHYAPIFLIDVIPCQNFLHLTSNASQFCPAQNVLPPPPPLPGPNDLVLTIGSAQNIAVGQRVCLDITPENFINVIGMQFSINYNPADLQFQQVTNFGLPGMASVNFGILPGTITVTWADPNVNGVTIPNDSTLFTLCFKAISSACTTELEFSNTPTAIEITNTNGEVLPFTDIPGTVDFNGSIGQGGSSPPPPPLACCEDVCVGAKVRYTRSFDMPSLSTSLTWTITGSLNYQFIDNNTVDVIWETPGIGKVRVNAGSTFVEHCVNVIAAPESGFISDPPFNNDTLMICKGQSVNFTNASQDAGSYAWQFGDDQSSTDMNTSHIWTEAGIYQMALIAFNECLCADTSFITIIVSPTLAPDLTCRGTVCEGTAVTYTTDAGCGTFIWTVSPNGIVTDGGGAADNFISIDWIHGPEGIVQLQVENCNDGDYCAEPNVLSIPVIDSNAQIQGPEQVCRAQAEQYTIASYGGVEYHWSVSSLGTIQGGQSSQSIMVQWANAQSTTPQWVAVEYYNCYLECGGMDTIWVNIRPDFYATGNVSVCNGSGVGYYARRSDVNMGVVCNWKVIDEAGTTLWSSPNPTAATDINWGFGSGDFMVIATPISSQDYCLPFYTFSVEVHDLPPPLTAIEGETFICTGLDYSYLAIGALSGNSIKWQLSYQTGATYLEGNPINIQYQSTGPNMIRVQQQSSQFCLSPFTQITPMPLPSLVITGDTALCSGQTGIYSVADFDRVTYDWSIFPADAGTILNALNTSSIEILWHHEGTAEIRLSVCSQDISLPVVVHPTPAPEVVHPDYLCPGETIQVQTTQGYTGYSWRNESGTTISNLAEPSIPYGYYQVITTNEFGCTGNARFKIEGYPKPDISVSTPDNAGLCPGDPPSTLYALDTEEGYTYQWYFNGNPVVDSTHVTYSTTQLGDYQVEVTDHNGCIGLSNIFTLGYYCGPMGGGFPGGYPGTGGGGGGGIPSDCEPNTSLQFQIQSTAACNQSNYTIVAPNLVPGSQVWIFGDPDSGPSNTSILANPSHTFSRAGFFQIILLGEVFNPGPISCYAIGVDTVPLAANFYFEKACAGDAINFFDASTFLPIETIASWQWDFGDPTSGAANASTLKDPMHAYQTAGTYNVTLTVTAASGCTATMTKQVEVFSLPSVHFEPPGDHCAASASVFVADVSNNIIDVVWNFGDPGSGAADSSDLVQPFHRYESVGTYTATLLGTTIYGCKNDFSDDVSIMANDLSGTIAFTSPICEGDTAILTSPPGGSEWLWSTGDTTETIGVEQSGVYSLQMHNTNGCAYQPTNAVLYVIPAPTNTIRTIHYNEDGLPTGYDYDSLSVCTGEDVFLEVTEQSGQSYQWSNSQSGSTLEFSEERNSLLPVGDHEIFVTVTDTESGCTNSIGPFVITVHPLPDMPVIAASPGGLVCEGTEVALSVNNPQATVSYLWSSGASGTIWQTSQAGQHHITATNEWGCTNNSDPYTILPGPNVNLIPSGCHTRCRPDTLCFPTVPNIASYQWYFNGEAQGPAVSTVPEIVIAESGEYYLQMVTNDGCSLNSDPLTLDLFDGYGNITGQVYWDRNNNGILDAADSLLTGIPFILSSNNIAIDTVLSQSGGFYGFTNILSTNYSLQLDITALPPGFTADTTQIDTALVGCDVEALVNWRLVCVSSTGSLTLNACGSNTVDYYGTPLMPGTSTDFTYSNVVGCDSVVTVTVLPSSSSVTALTFSTCAGIPIDYNGTPLLPGTSTDFTYTNIAGCDSIVTVTITPLSLSTTTVYLNACTGNTADYNGIPLAPGTHTDFTFTNAVGCDSIVTVMVTELSASTTTINLSACHGSTADYNGTPLMPGTTTDFTYTNAAGCDSLITVIVAELMPSSATLILNACPGGTIEYQGITLSSGETADFTFTNAVGCDSIVNVGLVAYSLPSYSISLLESCPNTPTGSIEVFGPDFVSFALGGTSQTSGFFTGLPGGVYPLSMEDNHGCIQETQVQLNTFESLQIAVENPSLPCNGESVTLTVDVISGDDGNLQLHWEDGTNTTELLVNTAGTYTVTATNNCEVVTQPVMVDYVENPEGIPVYIPNAFSPNDDGINDEFKVFVSNDVTVLDFEIVVFDRWGNQLYHSRDIGSGWDGFFRSKALNPDVYSWWVRANLFYCGDSVIINKKGEITLIR